MKRIVLTCAALLLSGQALADDCANANTQIEMNTCAAEQYKAADAKLNETYQNALKRAAPTQRDLLKKAQNLMDNPARCRLRVNQFWHRRR